MEANHFEEQEEEVRDDSWEDIPLSVDAFHVMDRIKVPMHHDFKPSFFRAIRAAIFVLNPEDDRQLKAALHVTSNKFVA